MLWQHCHACSLFVWWAGSLALLSVNVPSKIMQTGLIVCAGSEVDLSKIDNTAKSGAVLAPEIELDNSPIPSRVTAPAEA